MGRKAKGHARDAAVSRVGARIRAHRLARGLTLKELGAACNLSHPFLSQVERGLARPSIETLTSIAEALGTTVAALTGPQPRTTVSFVTHDSGRTTEGAAVPSIIRETIESASLLEALESTFYEESSPTELMAHPGEEFVYMIEGALQVEIGDETYVMQPGDALTFDATTPHRYKPLGPGRALGVVTTMGQPERHESLEAVIAQRRAAS